MTRKPHPRALTLKRLRILHRKMLWVHKNARELFDQDHTGAPACGMPGCTGGWAETIPSFRRDRIVRKGWLNFFGLSAFENAQVFGMSWCNAIYTPLESARNIAKLIKEIEAS